MPISNFTIIKMNKLRYGLYVGSFDPFHIGHEEVINVCLKYVNKIFILPNNPNKNKILRSDLNHRINIIKLSIKNKLYLDKIYVVDEDCDTFVNSLDNNIQKIGILGLDQYNILINNDKPPKLKVNEWLIIPRDNYDSVNKENRENKENKFNVPVKLLDHNLFKNQSYSSTFIRDQIFRNNYINLPVFMESLNYIKENGMYTPKDILLKELKYISKENNINIIKDTVGIINQTNNILVVKMLIDEKNGENLLNDELESRLICDKFKIKNIPKLLNVIYRQNYKLIILEYKGRTLEELVIENKNNGYELAFSLGKSLKQLHDICKIYVEYDDIINNYKIQKIIKKYGNNDKFKELLENFFKNSGSFGIVHGDANLSNFVKSDLDNDIYLIDIGKISKNFYNGLPIGIPAFEYFQMLSSIKWKILDEDLQKIVIDGFKDGYGTIYFSNDAIKLCEYYWNMFI